MVESQAGSIVPQLILVLILTAVNGFFSSAEMATFSVNKNRIKMLADEGNKRKRRNYYKK